MVTASLPTDSLSARAARDFFTHSGHVPLVLLILEALLARPGYFATLSADSVRSLALQGGVFSDAAAQAFIRMPGAQEAVRLRIWDDLAKTEGLPTPPLAHYLDRARRCMVAAA